MLSEKKASGLQRFVVFSSRIQFLRIPETPTFGDHWPIFQINDQNHVVCAVIRRLCLNLLGKTNKPDIFGL